MRACLALGLLLAGCNCSSRSVPLDASTRADGGASIDAAPAIDSGPTDSGIDSGIDSGNDAGAPIDAGAIDSGQDASARIDAGRDAGPAVVQITECASFVPGPEGRSGLALNRDFFPGFRFELTAPAAIVRVGLTVHNYDPVAGTLFAGLVRLSDASDVPDDPALDGADVVSLVLIPLPTGSASMTVFAPMPAIVPAGWYALVFGTGSRGATISNAIVPSQSGAGGCTALPSGGFPFSIRQSDGNFVLQAATPHFFVEHAAP